VSCSLSQTASPSTATSSHVLLRIGLGSLRARQSRAAAADASSLSSSSPTAQPRIGGRSSGAVELDVIVHQIYA
jgi:hypothetical protein